MYLSISPSVSGNQAQTMASTSTPSSSRSSKAGTPLPTVSGSAATNQLVLRERGLIEAMASQYCNPDVSDVTLQVGTKTFPSHRFVLAIQSPVFRAMLMGNKWKESSESLIQLEELDQCEAVFGDFLKFFYVGKIELNCQNVCSVHTLADKYDVGSLNADCVNFMRGVLSGPQGIQVLKTALSWIPYIDRCIPQLLNNCITSMQSSFLEMKDSRIDLSALSVEHIKAVLGNSNANRVVVNNELLLYNIIQKWILQTRNPPEWVTSALQSLLPLIRFYNMDANEIEEVKKSTLGKQYGNGVMKEHLAHAYKVQAEMFAFSVKAPKKRKLSDGGVENRCPCKSSIQCQHVNPRLYLNKPFGKKLKSRLGQSDINRISFGVVDLSCLKSYMKIYTGHDKVEKWRIRWASKTNVAENTMVEHFTVTPAACHFGRTYTLVIAVKYSDKNQEISYTIINTGRVTMFDSTVRSPSRIKNKFELTSLARFYVAVYLHSGVQVSGTIIWPDMFGNMK